MNYKNEIEEYHSEKIGGMRIVTFLFFLFIMLIGGCFVAAFGQSGSGYVLPSLTTAQRNALVSPALTEVIRNTTVDSIQIYTSDGWKNIDVGGSGNTNNIDTVATVARIGSYNGTAKAIVVTDSLAKGLFVLATGTHTGNNTLQYQAANGNWYIRLFDGHYNILWFYDGDPVTGDLTVALDSAVAVSPRTQSGAFSASVPIYIPSGNYRKATQFITDRAVHIYGDIGQNNSNTVINDVNGTGFYFQHSNQAGVSTVADASRFEDLKIIGNGTGTAFDVHAQINMDNLYVTGYEKGIYVNADLSQTTGNANHCNYENVVVNDCDYAILLSGDDANTNTFYQCHANNSVWGIVDSSLLNNNFNDCHFANDSIAIWSKIATSGSQFKNIYVEGGSGSRPNNIEINAPSVIEFATIGATSQSSGTGFQMFNSSVGRVIWNSLLEFENNTIKQRYGGQAGGNQFYNLYGKTDTGAGYTARYSNGNYVWAYNAADNKRVFQMTGNATTLTNQYGTTRTTGELVFPWGFWVGGESFTGNSSARLTGGADTTNILSPVNGDIFFNSTLALGSPLWYYDGKWKNALLTSAIADEDNDTKIQVEESPDEDTIRFDAAGNEVFVMTQFGAETGYNFDINGGGFKNTSTASQLNFTNVSEAANLFLASDGDFELYTNGTVTPTIMLHGDGSAIGIATATINASAALDVVSTTKGFLPPRMTTVQRNAISSPATGLTIFCTDCTATDTSTGVLQTYSSGSWRNHY